MPRTRPKRPTGGITAPFPGFIEPALATSIDREPSGSRWVHEIKFDGYRVQVHLRDGAAKVFTRRGNDWTNCFRKIASDDIDAGSAEVVAPAADGTTDFAVLQNELKGRSKKIVLVAFDLLYLYGYDFRTLPLFERKAMLKQINAETDIQFSESFVLKSMASRCTSMPVRPGSKVSSPKCGIADIDRPLERLGQEGVRSARDLGHRRLRARRQ